jgi:hypothetical protein
VGLTQLTSPGLQTQADRLGGCWVPKNQLRVGFRFLAGLIAAHGPEVGIRLYNGSGQPARDYAKRVLQRQRYWHKVLMG